VKLASNDSVSRNLQNAIRFSSAPRVMRKVKINITIMEMSFKDRLYSRMLSQNSSRR
jgi:hypothetical protein